MSLRRDFCDHLDALLGAARPTERAELLADFAEEISNRQREDEPDAFAISKDFQLREQP